MKTIKEVLDFLDSMTPEAIVLLICPVPLVYAGDSSFWSSNTCPIAKYLQSQTGDSRLGMFNNGIGINNQDYSVSLLPTPKSLLQARILIDRMSLQ